MNSHHSMYDHGRMRGMTAEEIVDRAARKAESWRYLRRWCAAAAIVILVGITEPIHSYLRAHTEFLWGMLAGSLLQVPGWLWATRWMLLRKKKTTAEEFPGGDSCGDDAVRWQQR